MVHSSFTRAARIALPHLVGLAGVLLVSAASLTAGTTPEGFFDEYLVLGPYNNVGRDNPGVANQSQDFLCDGTTSEENIVPADALELGAPDTAGCAKDDSGYLGTEPAVPTVKRIAVTGDLLDLDANLMPNEAVMAYAWIYVKNVTASPLHYRLGLASDDGITAEVNRVEVLNLSIPRGYDVAGVIQNRVNVTLLPGGNLIQFKAFEGGGGWGFRARFESSDTCEAVVSGGGQIEVGVEPLTLATFPGTARRTIVTSGSTQADVTINVTSGGAPFTLVETFGPGFTASNVSNGGVVNGRTITFMNVTAPSVSYRLTRSTPFTTEEGTLTGDVTVAGISVPVDGDTLITGSSPGFVGEALLTPAFDLGAGKDGCNVGAAGIEGPWIGDGNTLTDANIVPSEGMDFFPAYGTADSQAAGLTNITNQGQFWTIPGDAAASGALLAKVQPDANGLYNYNDVIYGGDPNNTMNVAYFYVVNSSAEDPLITYMGVGSDDGIGVRVNGRPVWTNPACRGFPGFTDKFPIALDAGKNLVAVYTFEAGGGFAAGFRFEDAEGIPIVMATTLDPAGYNPDPAAHPVHELPPPSTGIYSELGFVTQFLVPELPFEQPLTSNTNANAVPEDYITVGGAIPSADNVREESQVGPGSTGAITTAVRGDDDNSTPLVFFDGVNGPAATPADPGLFNGETFYGNTNDNYSSTLFFFLNNKTGADRDVFIGFASDDAGTLFVNGANVAEFLTGRGYGAPNTIETGPVDVTLHAGLNLVQLSYNEGGGGSGARVAVYANCSGTILLDPAEVEVTVSPGGTQPTVFCRGDTDQNGVLQLTDAVQVLNYLFLGTPTRVPDCLDAADADDNGEVQLTDAVRILGFLFLGAPPPAAPGPPPGPCGIDPTEDALGCNSYAPPQ